MGVPKFYRWISERYPCLSEVVKEYQVPEFDNLYLDMNGIIHNCSHPNDDDPHFRITEEQIFKDIFHYIEVLFRIIRPRKNFFMAVDGVAPRAKMNQQRGRRFRSAKEAEQNIKLALLKGETLPSEKRFDSNCITPGTKFMEKLQTQLEYFVKTKVTYDSLWQGVNIYLSGHQTPGEGEHKVMEFIRHERSQPGYDPNTRHCLYGLDADLMMLALCSHEPHFVLLREEVKFTSKKSSNKTTNVEETTFHLLHISLMREYIDHEFGALKDSISFPYDVESIIDDWVLMGFLVGNDFIPHLPDFHIAKNALPLLYKTYIEVLPKLDGYINESGIINLKRFQVYLDAISSFDIENFEEKYDDYMWLQSKTKSKEEESDQIDSTMIKDIRMVPKSEEKSIQIVKDLALRQGMLSSDDNESEDDDAEEGDLFLKEFKHQKKGYYSEKFQVTPSTPQIQSIAFEYILGLQWICHYYYNGVQSWSWYYPYHYSPYVSDLTNVDQMKLKYKMNKPFLPYQQLLAVLPAASKDCIPEAYWNLMDEQNSVIGDFYPTNFSADLNGKTQEWEAVVLIPFIDETRLLEAMESCTGKLLKEERCRNQHGPCQLYVYDADAPYFEKSTLPGAFPDIERCLARKEKIPLHSWCKKNYKEYVKGLLPGCQLSVYYQGFPTLYHIPHKAALKKQGVKVFQMMSRNENMILYITSKDDQTEIDGNSVSGDGTLLKDESLEEVAKRLIGNVVYVNWPHMEEAKVIAVSDGDVKIVEEQGNVRTTSSNLVRVELNRDDSTTFVGELHDIQQKHLNSRGIEIGDTKVLVYAKLLVGHKYVCGKKGDISMEKQWSATIQAFALQMVLKNLTVKGPTFESFKSLNELFPKDVDVFNLSNQHYGCMGKVVEAKHGTVSVKLETLNEPDLDQAFNAKRHTSSYYFGARAASMAGISSYLLSRITGSIYVFFPSQKKWNIGLNLKFTKQGYGIAGFTKRENNNWFYSHALVGIIEQYYRKFPEVFKYLGVVLKNSSESDLNAEDIFKTENVTEKLEELSGWLKLLPCHNGRKVHESSSLLEPATISSLDEIVTSFKETKPKIGKMLLKVLPHFLYRPMPQQGTILPDINAQHKLLDRVVNVRMGYTVPLGYRGTIIGIHAGGGTEKDMMCDVMFDEEFLGGLTLGSLCPVRRGYKLPASALVNLSYGGRLNKNTSRSTANFRSDRLQNDNYYRNASPNQRISKGNLIQSPHSAFHSTRKAAEKHKPITLMKRTDNVASDSFKSKTLQEDVPSFTSITFSNGRKHSNTTQPVQSKPLIKRGTSAVTHTQNTSTQMAKSNSSKYLHQAAQWLHDLPQNSSSLYGKSDRNQNAEISSSHGRAVHATNTHTTMTSVENPSSSTRFDASSHQPTNPVESATTNDSNHSRKDAENSKLSNMLKSALKISVNVSTVSSADTATAPSNLQIQANDQEQFKKLLAGLQPSKPPINPSAVPPAIPSQGHIPRQHQHYPPPLPPPPHIAKHFSLQEYLLSRPPPPPTWDGSAAPPFSFNSFPPQLYQFPPPPLQPPHMNPPSRNFNLPPEGSQPPFVATTRSTSNFLKEGTDKLCEILSIGNEEKKFKEEYESPAAWSTTSLDESVQPNENGGEDEANEDKACYELRNDKEKPSHHFDEDILKSPYIEDSDTNKNAKDKKISYVDELFSWCRLHKMYPPIYTYCDATQEKKQLICTVQLWNGVRFQSSPQSTRDEAMEHAALLALASLNKSGVSKENDVAGAPCRPTMPVSYAISSVQPGMLVSHPSYLVEDMSSQSRAPLYNQADIGPMMSYMMSPNSASVPVSAANPGGIPFQRLHPSVLANIAMNPRMMMYPPPPMLTHPYPVSCSQPYYPVGRQGIYPPPFTAAVPSSVSINNGVGSQTSPFPISQITTRPSQSSSPSVTLHANSIPFIPSQVQQARSASSKVNIPTRDNLSPHCELTGSPNYILSDQPALKPTSSADKSSSSSRSRKKSKPKLAISFNATTK